MKIKYIPSFIFLFACVMSVYAQNEFSGKVVAFNEIGLNKVEIYTESGQRATSDMFGNFNIQIKRKEKITFEAKGFEKLTSTVSRTSDETIFNLVFLGGERNEELAVNNEHISKEKLIYALENLQNQTSKYAKYNNIFDVVRREVPNLQAVVEGNVQKFQVRGVHSILGSSAALMVVDNMVVDDIGFVQPSEVKSVKFLSSAQATSYGSRGANGVIAIVTNKK